jgi:hypothetical protein
MVMNGLARAYHVAGRLPEALTLFEETLKLKKAKQSPDHHETLGTMNDLAGAYLDAHRWSEAEHTSRECLAGRAAKTPDDWRRFHTMSQLGAALAGQKRFTEAEPLILQGYEGPKAREAKFPAEHKKHLAEAAARIVRLYETWGKTDKATTWKAKLGMPDLPAEVFARP